jgi:hypothetical protein
MVIRNVYLRDRYGKYGISLFEYSVLKKKWGLWLVYNHKMTGCVASSKN